MAKLLLTALISLVALTVRAETQGTVKYAPAKDESSVAKRFQLAPQKFAYQTKWLDNVSDEFRVAAVTFRSPVQTPHEKNNTVHCEYFQPVGKENVPGVIVLHILGGDFPLSRLFCAAAARRGVAALFVKMPYYGPRRQPDVDRRMISVDPNETVAGMTQAVLDIRFATAWLASRAEVDDQQLGIFGISLGGITGALAAAAEPRLKKACLLLAGGDITRIAWESPVIERARKTWLAMGKTREEFTDLVRLVDPVTYAANLQGRRLLMINATGDEIIPKACTESLWTALGKPEIVWHPGGHYTVAKRFFSILARSLRFFDAAKHD